MRTSIMMKIIGVIFLLLGVVWFSTIAVRGKNIYDSKHKKVTYQQVSQSIQKSYQRMTLVVRKSSLLNSSHARKFVVVFIVIAGLEVLCSLLYVVAGVSILRNWKWGRGFGLFALVMDVFLKVFAVNYHQAVLIPLERAFHNSNILFQYFGEKYNSWPDVSSFLSGVKFLQDGAVYWILLYAVFLAVSAVVLGINRNGGK